MLTACAPLCIACDTNGPDKCDATKCISASVYNSGTQKCDGKAPLHTQSILTLVYIVYLFFPYSCCFLFSVPLTVLLLVCLFSSSYSSIWSSSCSISSYSSLSSSVDSSFLFSSSLCHFCHVFFPSASSCWFMFSFSFFFVFFYFWFHLKWESRDDVDSCSTTLNSTTSNFCCNVYLFSYIQL